MTKRNKTRQLFSKLIVDEFWNRISVAWNTSEQYALDYKQFIRSQSRKNNCYKMALKAIGG